MRNVGALAQFERQQIPPVKKPAVHARERPLTLNPLLDPACELCLLPIEGAEWHDYSQNGYDGALTGAAFNSLGRYGPAVGVNAAAAWVNCTVALACNFVAGDFSVECWVFNLNPGAANAILRRGLFNTDGWQLNITNLNELWFYTYQAAANQNTRSAINVIPGNAWTHVIVRRQGAGVQTFVNGADVTVLPAVHINPVGNAGRILDVGVPVGVGLVGMFDLVRIYSRFLGDQEILDLYNQGRPQWMG